MREGPPLQRVTLWNGLECWTVTGHAEARQLLADPRVSADRRRDGFPTVSERFAGLTEAKPTFLAMDDPEHNRIRRMMISEFTVRRFKELKPKIVAVVDDAIDGLLAAGSPTDLVEHFSLPVPSMVICHMLGVPYADHEFFQKHSRLLVQGTSDDVRVARVALVGYLAELAMDPPPGLIARLKADQVATGQLSKEDLAINAMVLLLAGHETTASMLSLGVITLLDHPDQLALLKSDPAAAATSVEELLRYLSIVDAGPSRIATEDIEIGGVTVKAGDGLVITSSLANRDPSVFADPDSFDITRPARHHVAFGYGVHQCLGQNLARMELELALPALFRRIPTLRLDVAVADLTLRPAATIQGVNSLPVAW
ncbi:cytochrome P450 [Actinocrispum wychmicini]|nr:cytochrome P450 [Actinocrispum wychmicini]